MDPNRALDELRKLLAVDSDLAGSDVAVTFKCLDFWLTDGGSLPDDWKRGL
jgi:hypothetical protein